MGEIVVKHRGKTAARVSFPYTPSGEEAIRQAERVVKRLAKRAWEKRRQRSRRLR